MSIKNNSSKTVITRITAQNCMYDHGTEGSKLYWFNDHVIKSLVTVPQSGGIYIEAKASGACNSQSPMFDLKVLGLNKDQFTISFDILHPTKTYRCKNQPANVSVNIDNSDDQATIIITLNDPN